MDKLKTCPFCGEPVNVRTQSRLFGTIYWVQCMNDDCTANPASKMYYEEQKAIEAWNTRKGEENG